MCFIQLTLWNIPAVVVVGDTLANEEREVFYTPSHYLGFWDVRLKRDSRLRAAELEAEHEAIELLVDDADDAHSDEKLAQIEMAWII